MQIEPVRIKNDRLFGDAKLDDLPPMAVVALMHGLDGPANQVQADGGTGEAP